MPSLWRHDGLQTLFVVEITMKTSRVGSLVWGALLFATPLLSAQAKSEGLVVKKKVVSPDQYQKMTEPSSERGVLSGETLSNGDFVSLRRKNVEGRLNGIFVYEDAKNQRIFVRPRPHAVPVAVPTSAIEDIERIVPANTQAEKGGIRFATEEGAAAPHREIVAQYIYNGSTREVRYYGATLSSAEKQELAALEKAAHELAQDEEAVTTMEQAITAQPTAAAEAAREARLAAASANGPFGFEYYTYNNNPTNFGGNFLNPVMPFFGGFGRNSVNVSVPPPPAPVVAPAPSLAEMQKSLQTARERVEQDRKTYLAARSRAIFDATGDIVAVRLDEK
jgi:hypothetical protein